MEVLGEKIKYYRNSLHLGQSYVARYLNLSLEDYCELERGRSVLNIDDVKKLCTLFGVTTVQLTESKCSMGLNNDDDDDDDWDIARAIALFATYED